MIMFGTHGQQSHLSIRLYRLGDEACRSIKLCALKPFVYKHSEAHDAPAGVVLCTLHVL